MRSFTNLRYIFLTVVLSLAFANVYAQCANNNVQFLTWAAPSPGNSVSTTCIFGGEFNRVTNMQAGTTYRIATCGTSWDTQITIYPSGGGPDEGFNDDACGLQSEIFFTPPVTGDYDILVDEFFCVSNSSCATLEVEALVPGYCTNGLYTSGCAAFGDGIQNFSISNLNHTGSGCSSNGYGDFTSMTANLFAGQTYNWTITFLNSDAQGVGIWVDFNDDLDFDDAGEFLGGFGTFVGSGSGTITIPAGAALGQHRMRVRENFNNVPAAGGSCATVTWGETHDYTVNIAAPPLYEAEISNSAIEEYTVIPLSQTPFAIEASAENIGLNTITGVTITTNIYDASSALVFTASSTPTSLAPGSSTSFTPPPFIPNIAGVYTIEHSVAISEPEFDLSNNLISYQKEVSDTLYSRDNDTPAFAMGIGAGTPGSMGNEFEIFNTTALRAGMVTLGNPNAGGGAVPTIGSTFTIALWSMDGGVPDTMIAETPSVTVTSTAYQQHVVDFDQPIILQPGTYLLTIEEPAANPNVAVSAMDQIYTPTDTWIRFPGNPFGNAEGWSNPTPFPAQFRRTPAVRMILDDGCLLAVAGADTVVCEGEPVQLGGAPTGSLGTGPYTYSWTPAAYLDDATSPNPTATPDVTTIYTVTVTDDLGCWATDEVTITVNPLPATDLNGLAAAYCEGDDQDTLQISPAGGTLSGPGATVVTNTYAAAYTGPAVSIPDGAGVNANADLTPTGIPGTATGVDVELTQVCFEIDHTWIGDLVVELVSPNGTVVPLADQPGVPALFFGCSGDNIDACVIPGTGNSMENECGNNPAISGTWTAHTGFDLASLNDGSDPNGTWSLRARDMVGGDPGTIESFTLTFSQSYAIFNPGTAGAGTHVISYCVTDANGCTGCDEDTVVVNPAPDASFSTASPYCANETDQFVGATPGGNFSGPGIINPATGEFDAATAGVGTHWIYYSVTDANGCFGMDSAQVVVTGLPTADAGADQTVCQGTSVTIGGSPSGSTTLPGTFIVQYTWAPATGLNATSDQNPVATPNATTTYTLTVTDNNGCTDSDEVTVTVNPNPIVNAGANQTVCNASTVTLGGFPTVQGATPPYTYTWAPAAGLNNPNDPNPIATASATTTYTVTVTDANGCVGTDQVTITVNPNPVADAGNNQVICSGGSAVIGGAPSGTGGTAPYTYSWAPATGLNNTAVANPTASPAATTTYTVTVTDVNGCSSTDMVTVTVNQGVVVDAGADQDICAGSTVQIGGAPTASGGNAPFQYSWSPNVGLTTPSASNPFVNPQSTVIYTVTVTDANGCSSSDVVTVTVNPNPVVNAGADQNICAGEVVTIGGGPTATNGTGPYTYTWSPSFGLANPTASNPQASPGATTTYTVTVTDANGCSNTDNVTVFVSPSPTANAGLDQSVCLGGSVTIGGNPSGFGGSGALTYNWFPSNGLNSATNPNPVATPNATRTYILTVSDGNGCSDSDTVQVTVNPLPTPTITGLDPGYCIDAGIVTIAGVPAGGTFTGTGIAGTTFDPSAAGPGHHLITYTYTDVNGCTGVVQQLVTVNGNPVVDAGPDLTVSVGDTAVLEAIAPPGGIYTWTPSDFLNDPTILRPTITPDGTVDQVTYTLNVTDANGCEGMDQVTVTFDFGVAINPPNTFTPNGDGINDDWRIPLLEQFFGNNNVKVYNRWGTLVEDITNYGSGNAWTGNDLPEGTYFYVITVDHPSQAGRVHKGTITIIR